MAASDDKNKLFTRFEFARQPLIGAGSRIFFCGSCFTENIGRELNHLGFDTFINPYGILFDPLSIERSLSRIQTLHPYSENNLYFSNGAFRSLDHHGSFAHAKPDALLSQISHQINNARSFLLRADIAVITLGTSWVYYHTTTNRHVANCHKIPNHEFTKNLLSESEIVGSLNLTVSHLKKINPNIRIIFTISPVKHLRDGIMENAVSKARLQSALHQFLNSPQGNGVMYFPAYEIMTEELRDHRFYSEDKAHPSDWSIRYIFNRFTETHFDDRASEYLKKAMQFRQMEAHRSLGTDQQIQREWEVKKQQFLNDLKAEYPESRINSQAQ